MEKQAAPAAGLRSMAAFPATRVRPRSIGRHPWEMAVESDFDPPRSSPRSVPIWPVHSPCIEGTEPPMWSAVTHGGRPSRVAGDSRPSNLYRSGAEPGRPRSTRSRSSLTRAGFRSSRPAHEAAPRRISRQSRAVGAECEGPRSNSGETGRRRSARRRLLQAFHPFVAVCSQASRPRAAIGIVMISFDGGRQPCKM